MIRKNLLIAAIVLLLVALGNWLTEEGARQVDRRLAPSEAPGQEYFLNDFTITALDEHGLPQHRLQAEELNHFVGDQPTQLQQPRMVIYEQQREAWHVRADHGTVEPQGDTVWLLGGVKLEHNDAKEPLQLTTSRLRLHPSQGRADSDAPVTLSQAGSRIDAVGIEIEQQGQQLTLLSQVRGRYEALVH